MDDARFRLAHRFRKQQEFAAGYSPLYARLFGLLADWLTVEPGDDPLVGWLIRAGAGRSSFDVPLLLLAGLHRDILCGCPEVQALGRFFPSVGGTLPATGEAVALSLRQAILARQECLAEFIATATVQTNESARGFCWLLPATYPGWPAIHLVDLGASAGLNLVADQRQYRLADSSDGRVLMELGCGAPEHFVMAGSGAFVAPKRAIMPIIRTRLGCDLAPMPLRTADDERNLAAFVWGDQLQRLALLRQGVAVLRQVNRTGNAVQLHQVDLADEFSRFADAHLSVLDDAPVVISTTYLTTYLHDKGFSLRSQLARWAVHHPQPVLWLQWETLWNGPKPPDFGWVGWTADLWMHGRHHHWQLAWAHPHGSLMSWLPGQADWAEFWRQHSRHY